MDKSWVGPAIRTGIGLYSAYSQTRTNRTRKRKFESTNMQGSTTLRRVKRRYGRKKRRSTNRVFRELLSRGNRVVFRWQQVSNSLLGPGRVAIQWADQAGTEYDKMPMHFMSISQYPFGTTAWSPENGGRADGLKVLQYANAFPGNGSWVYFPLPSQLNTGGSDDPTGAWYLEQQSGMPAPESDHTYRHHAWTQVKFNLYGTQCVPVTYRIMFFQCPQQYDIQHADAGLPGHAAGTDVANMLKDMIRPITGNNLNQNGRVDWPKDVRILKQYTRTIQPLPYGDQWFLNEAAAGFTTAPAKTGHIESLNIFFQHDRNRDYRWLEAPSEQIDTIDLTKPTWDVYKQNELQNDVEWGKKVYMLITASCPERVLADRAMSLLDNEAPSVDLTRTAGSYDIVVRQCFYLS